MSTSVPFQQADTWRKLGYLYFNNSLEYREVLKQNPQWTVTELPPLGAQIRIDSPNEGGSPSGLSQGAFIFNETEVATSDDIFPYQSETNYNEALERYTLQGVVDREILNGISFDSVQAITGSQAG